jgi:hypothetical protein
VRTDVFFLAEPAVMPKRGGGSYDPADNGLAKYFLAMLDDRDRNIQYGEGIRAAIEEFKQREKRAPTVLDVGVGTGMLSGLCLTHGAKHVTGVDVLRPVSNCQPSRLASLSGAARSRVR